MVASRAFCLIVLALLLMVDGQTGRSSSPNRPKPSPFTGTYVNQTGDWKILDLGDGKLRVACSLTYAYRVRGLLTANTGEASGTADINGKTASFKPEGTTACTITLRFAGKRLSVKQEGSDADCGFGHNVYANGTYSRQSRRRPRFDEEK